MYSKVTKRLSTALSVVVIILSCCDVIATASAPWWLNFLYKNNFNDIRPVLGYNESLSGIIFYLMLAFFIVCGILALIILIEGERILLRIHKDNPFCVENAVSLKNAAICAFILFALFMAKMFFSPSILTAICGAIFILFGLFILVISQLVRTAAKIKEENDLTI